jgi:1-acyl-sn-glycerol-3-phosphate acyltransferase
MRRLREGTKGALAAVLLGVNTIAVVACMLPLALVKLAFPAGAPRAHVDRALNALAEAWIEVNGVWIGAMQRIRWDVAGLDGLDPGRWYVVSCNHQSWIDIFVLQKVLVGRVPLLKFFLKKNLIFVPFAGLAWWALDFPFVRRGGGAAAARADFEAARRSCERFRATPTSVMSFLEGTRYTPHKALAQRSPYRHLLKPKAGGMATALATLGERVDALLDVTIVYPRGVPAFWDLLAGRIEEVVVRVRAERVPQAFTQGDFAAERSARAELQAWLEDLWTAKDLRIAQILEDRLNP